MNRRLVAAPRTGAGGWPRAPDAGGPPPVRADRVRALRRAGPCGAGGAVRVGSAARCAAPALGVPAMRRADGQRVDRLRGDRPREPPGDGPQLASSGQLTCFPRTCGGPVRTRCEPVRARSRAGCRITQ